MLIIKFQSRRIFFEGDESSDSENDENLDDFDFDDNDDDDGVEDLENNKPNPQKIFSADEYDSRESISGNNKKVKGALMFSGLHHCLNISKIIIEIK